MVDLYSKAPEGFPLSELPRDEDEIGKCCVQKQAAISSSLPIISKEERGNPCQFVRFSDEWLKGSLMHRFQAVVEAYEDRVAVQDQWSDKIGDVSWTYGYLGLRVTLLSELIRKKNLPKEQPIALYVDQGRHFILAVLAVMLSGHFWTPLDPASASERNTYILKDSTASTLITMKDKVHDEVERVHDH